MQKTAKLGTDFTEGNILRHMLTFLLPFLLANVLNSVYSLVDMIVIGRFAGSEGTVAVSQGGEILILLTTFSNGIASGGQVYIGQLFGAKKFKDINSTIGTLLTALLIGAVVCAAVCLVFTDGILNLLNTPSEAFAGAKDYFIITTLGLPFVFGYNAVSSILRAMGDSKNPLVFIAIATVLNLVLDIAFIVIFDMGAAGTALATIIGQTVSLTFSLRLLYKKRAEFGFDFKRESFRINSEKLKIMLKIGVPLASKGLFIHVSQLFVLSCVNAYGLIQATVYNVANKILTYSNIVCMSSKMAGSAMVAQNLGAKKPERAKKICWIGVCVCGAFSIVCIAASIFLPRQLFLIFTKDAAVLEYARRVVYISIVVHVVSAIESGLGCVVTGSGNARLQFITGFLDSVVLRIGLGLVFGRYMGMEVVGFFLGSVLARLAPCVIESAYFFSGAWIKRKTLVE